MEDIKVQITFEQSFEKESFTPPVWGLFQSFEINRVIHRLKGLI